MAYLTMFASLRVLKVFLRNTEQLIQNSIGAVFLYQLKLPKICPTDLPIKK